jgi:RNA recognition motif-containing protein
MRCAACDHILSSRESVRKSAVTGTYYDLCDRCFSTIEDQVTAVENQDLPEDGYDDEEVQIE